jgi:hypothetical protein
MQSHGSAATASQYNDEDASPPEPTVAITVQDFKKRLDGVSPRIRNMSFPQWQQMVDSVVRGHPLGTIMRYASKMYDRRMFTFDRCFSEAFLACPENVIDRPVPQVGGAGGSSMWERRTIRGTALNDACFTFNFCKGLSKFCTALGLNETATRLSDHAESMDARELKDIFLIGNAGLNVQGGNPVRRTRLQQMLITGEAFNVEVVRNVMDRIIAKYFSVPKLPLNFRQLKQVKVDIINALEPSLQAAHLLGRYNNVAWTNAWSKSDKFYLTLAYTVVCLQHQINAQAAEARRFVTFYENTTAFSQYMNYRVVIKVNYTFVDSQNRSLLLDAANMDIYNFFGSKLVRHLLNRTWTSVMQNLINLVVLSSTLASALTVGGIVALLANPVDTVNLVAQGVDVLQQGVDVLQQGVKKLLSDDPVFIPGLTGIATLGAATGVAAIGQARSRRPNTALGRAPVPASAIPPRRNGLFRRPNAPASPATRPASNNRFFGRLFRKTPNVSGGRSSPKRASGNKKRTTRKKKQSR